MLPLHPGHGKFLLPQGKAVLCSALQQPLLLVLCCAMCGHGSPRCGVLGVFAAFGGVCSQPELPAAARLHPLQKRVVAAGLCSRSGAKLLHHADSSGASSLSSSRYSRSPRRSNRHSLRRRSPAKALSTAPCSFCGAASAAMVLRRVRSSSTRDKYILSPPFYNSRNGSCSVVSGLSGTFCQSSRTER